MAEAQNPADQLLALCRSDNRQEKYNSDPQQEILAQMKDLVAGGARLSDEQLADLEAAAKRCADQASDESSAGDLNWSYESRANADRIRNYVNVYQKMCDAPKELFAICKSNGKDKYDDAPDTEKLSEMKELVDLGARMSDEQLGELEAAAKRCREQASNESSAGDLNWSYESQANCDRIRNYVKAYQQMCNGTYVAPQSQETAKNKDRKACVIA